MLHMIHIVLFGLTLFAWRGVTDSHQLTIVCNSFNDDFRLPVLSILAMLALAHCALLSIIFGNQSKWTSQARLSDVLLSIITSPIDIAPIAAELVVLLMTFYLRA